jgi:hypothetical protein
MIPRYQRIAYWALIAGILVLLGVLVHGRVRKQQRILAMRDQSPIPAPTDIATEQVSIAQASDADGSIHIDHVSLALPAEPSLRARVLIDRVLTDLSLPASAHPVPSGPALTDVFLVPLPLTNPAPSPLIPQTDGTLAQAPDPTPPDLAYHASGAMLAVVNLTKAFADAHPSGIEAEDLTLRAIIATLRANLPQIEQVRFLVDGQTRDTLNGHADLSRPYAITDPSLFIHTVSNP